MKYLLLVLICAGCARFQTVQEDLSYDPQGKPLRAVTTKVTVSTIFDSSSELAKSKATQSDKTQSASLGSLNQTATSTNLDQLIGVIVGAAVKAAVKSTVP